MFLLNPYKQILASSYGILYAINKTIGEVFYTFSLAGNAKNLQMFVYTNTLNISLRHSAEALISFLTMGYT